jgi:glycosyltransferase involved in cell wall biosynthesis
MTTKAAMPRLTVGFPVYNGEAWAAAALESVVNQTFTDWHMIICDNASTDRTGDICRGFADRDSRIRYIRNDENIGLTRNFNKAFELSNSEFFKWVAHDDICLPTFFERCIEALDSNPTAAIAYPLGRAIDGNGNFLDERYDWTHPQRYDQPSAAERFKLFTANFDRLNRGGVQHPGIFFFGVMRSSHLRKTRLQRSHMWSDVSMIAELALEGPFVEVPEVLSLMRVEIPHASAMMLQRNLQGWQEILDPRYATKFGTLVSRYWRYWEYFVSVGRSDLGLAAKTGLMGFCTTLIARRAYELVVRR